MKQKFYYGIILKIKFIRMLVCEKTYFIILFILFLLFGILAETLVTDVTEFGAGEGYGYKGFFVKEEQYSGWAKGSIIKDIVKDYGAY